MYAKLPKKFLTNTKKNKIIEKNLDSLILN
jgi:hypothetical protein